jgi:hypothetical protein
MICPNWVSNPHSADIHCLVCTSVCYILPTSALQWLTMPHGSSNVVRTQLSHRLGWRGPARKWRHRAPLQCSIKQIDDRVHRQITRRIEHRAECAPSTCAVVTTLKLLLLHGCLWVFKLSSVRFVFKGLNSIHNYHLFSAMLTLLKNFQIIPNHKFDAVV